ncbi:hypothetical protein HYS93_02095 [Candidatus Daviesbacteria bacterium]|nr:hypothetical protein [Candidatus Daviesbacteria bacterium]
MAEEREVFLCSKEVRNMREVNIEEFNPQANETETRQVTRAYAQVFAGEPWNEYTQCSADGRFYGLTTKPGDPCECGAPVGLAYPEDDVMAYIIKETKRPNALMLVAKDGDQVVGFSWGYQFMNSGQFASEKYRTPEMQAQVANILVNSGVFWGLYYFSETGIVPQYRGNGLTNEFYTRRIELAQRLVLPVVVRTNRVSPIVAVTQRFGFKQVMGPAVRAEDKRIVQLGGLANNILDRENEDRVLFVRDLPPMECRRW